MPYYGPLALPSILLFSRLSRLRERNFFAPMRDPPDASQHHPSERHKIRNVRENSVREHRKGIFGDVLAVAECLEGDGREQQHRSPADFFQAVDVVYVVAWVLADAFLGLSDQFIALAKFRRSRRTDLRACRLLSRRHAVRTHDALLHLGE